MTDTISPNVAYLLDPRRKTAIPDELAGKELEKHLTPRQIVALAQLIDLVRSTTGHGEVRITFKNGHPHKIFGAYGHDFDP